MQVDKYDLISAANLFAACLLRVASGNLGQREVLKSKLLCLKMQKYYQSSSVDAKVNGAKKFCAGTNLRLKRNRWVLNAFVIQQLF